MCGGLPLALQIIAALLKADPALSVGELAGELSAEKERLARLRYDDGSGRAGRRSRRRSSCPTDRLDETSARVFRLLPVNPGPDVSTAAAAVLADLPVGEVRAGTGRAGPGAPGRGRARRGGPVADA